MSEHRNYVSALTAGTPGTGPITLGAATGAAPLQSFFAAYGVGTWTVDVEHYSDAAGTVPLGVERNCTYNGGNPGTLTRGTFEAPSTGLLSLAAGGSVRVVMTADLANRIEASVSAAGIVSSTNYADLAALQAAFPAASNDGKLGLAASVLYVSTGGAWTATGGNTTPIVNSLTSTSTTSALSAAQGKALKDTADAQAVQPDHLSRAAAPQRLLGSRSSGLRLRKAINDVKAGLRQSLRIMLMGDSLSTENWTTANTQLARILAGHLNSTPISAEVIGLLGFDRDDITTVAATSANVRWTTATENNKTQYATNFDGTNVEFASGQYATYSFGGNHVHCDRILIPVITSSGAGSIKVEIASGATAAAFNSVAWRSPLAGEIASSHTLTGSELIVSANASNGVTVVALSVALGRWGVKLTHSSGASIKVLRVMQEVRNAAAINIYRFVATASNDFANVVSDAAPIVAGVIDAYDPDVVVVDSDDRLSAYQTLLPVLVSTLAATTIPHKPLVLLVGNPFYNNAPFTDSDIAARIAYCWDFASSRVGWDVLDLMAFVGGFAEASRAGVASDGIHYNGETASYDGTLNYCVSRGYAPFSLRSVGGNANLQTVLSASGGRQVTARGLSALLSAPTTIETGWMTWGFAAGGSSSGTRDAAWLRLVTGATTGSGVSAFINSSSSPLGWNQGGVGATSRGFGFIFRAPINPSAEFSFYVISGVRTFNAGYVGPLADGGAGFQVINNVAQGICWDNGALVVSSGSITVSTGPAGSLSQMQVVLRPRTVNDSRGTIEWFVNNVSIGTATYTHGGAPWSPPRFELSNNASASNFEVNVTPPRFALIGP